MGQSGFRSQCGSFSVTRGPAGSGFFFLASRLMVLISQLYNLALLSRFAVGSCFSWKSDLKFKVSKRVLEMQEKDSTAKKGVLRSRQGLLFSIFFFWLSFAFVRFHGRAM
jgi:hypothetical protein